MGSFRIRSFGNSVEDELRVWASRLLVSAMAESMGGTATKRLLVSMRLTSEGGQEKIDQLADRARAITRGYDELRDSDAIARAVDDAKFPTVTEKYDNGVVHWITVPNPAWVPDDFRELVPALALRILDQAKEHPLLSDSYQADALRLLLFTEQHLWKKKPIEPKELKPDFKGMGKKGGEVKNASMKALKLWAIEQWKDGAWKSRKDAARRLTPIVVEKGREFGVSLSPSNAERTIYDWIRGASDSV